jgi:plasmid maintenance system antidote protein VapI
VPKKKPATPGSRLRAAIEAKDMPIAEAARRLAIKPPSLHQILSGRRAVTLDWLHNAATVLGVDPAELDDRLASRKKNPE